MHLNYKLLFGDSWGPALRPLLSSDTLSGIFKVIRERSEKGEEIFPKADLIFAPFRECPTDKTMVVILGANPYYEHKKWTDGLLFSSTLTKPLIPKVEGLIFDAIEDNYDKKLTNREGDLKRWANQGVLLLPLDLTFTLGKKGSHIKLWEPFVEAIIQTIQTHCPGVIFVLLGQDALKMKDLLDPLTHDMVALEHPAKSVLMNRNWKHKNIFNYLDRVTNMIFNRKINWYV